MRTNQQDMLNCLWSRSAINTIRACRHAALMKGAVEYGAVEPKTRTESYDSRGIRSQMMIWAIGVFMLDIKVFEKGSVRALIEFSLEHITSCCFFELLRGEVTVVAEAKYLLQAF